MEHKIKVVTSLMPSAEDQADGLSRAPPDRGDYSLCQDLFLSLLPPLRRWVWPDWDIFASPGNNKFEKFVCRWPHWQASKLDALSYPLGGVPLLCQPPLEFGGALAGTIEGQPKDSVLLGHPLLGLSVVVAPISEASHPRKQVPPHPPVSRDVSGLLGKQVPPHKVAPPLHSIIRGVLQGRQVRPEGVTSYLSLLGDLRRYDGAFAHLSSKFVSSTLDPAVHLWGRWQVCFCNCIWRAPPKQGMPMRPCCSFQVLSNSVLILCFNK